jgi:hypothetical protein
MARRLFITNLDPAHDTPFSAILQYRQKGLSYLLAQPLIE